MIEINLTENEKQRLMSCLNERVEPPADLAAKLFPTVHAKFDFRTLNNARIPTIEYAGKHGKEHQIYSAIRQTLSDESLRQIPQTVSAKLQLIDAESVRIRQSLADELTGLLPLSWTHYTFLVQIENVKVRRFYEIEALQQGWSALSIASHNKETSEEATAMGRTLWGLKLERLPGVGDEILRA